MIFTSKLIVAPRSSLRLFYSLIGQKMYLLWNLIDSNVAFDIHLILELNPEHVKCNFEMGLRRSFSVLNWRMVLRPKREVQPLF